MSEHQKRQEKRREDYETIKVHYTHLKQVIINDETLEQTKKALEKFKTNKKMKAAGLRFNPALQRWLNIAEGRIARWKKGHPELEPPKSESKPKKKPKKEPEKEPDEGETIELSPTEEVTSVSGVDAETLKVSVEPDTVEENPHESEDENPHDTE